jgi:hypothetical protein
MKNKLGFLVVTITTVLVASSCATIVNDANIPLAVSFSDGSSGECTFRNKRGVWTSTIPTSSVMIRRSDDALVYDCSTVDGRRAAGSVRSEMEGGKMMASVMFWDLGITDAITDKHRTYQGNLVIPIKRVESDASKSDSIESIHPESDSASKSELTQNCINACLKATSKTEEECFNSCAD